MWSALAQVVKVIIELLFKWSNKPTEVEEAKPNGTEADIANGIRERLGSLQDRQGDLRSGVSDSGQGTPADPKAD